MNKVATQRQSRPLLSDLADLLDNLPAFAALRPFFETRTIRVEDELHDDMYEIRAELPGVDPEEDIEVTVRDGRVTITAQRSRAGDNCVRSEFAYGSFSRSLPLPDGADEDDVNAVYDRGILTVSVPLADEHRVEKHIEVVEIVNFEHDDLDEDDEDDDDVHEEQDDLDGADTTHDGADQQEHVHQG
ncbi:MULTISPECIES: Hsp20/alpha crystallin family protein [Mycolicibacterium]|uniref:Heat shock protein Hsp20 n=1 Tax=Mycolicibacterium vanbaalenii (strain DSM 7251 / JCM 13017 / BCRC 16820 / KCTC 9966 / NRRL B-24157 / PYR-1) TaxID=350058 RepID=A1TC18_MYCVP|nr:MULTISPECIES: Hsp20/alpha crystallin family protein [Mycolicibacterium]ABM14718.1 heat shock protein Hsp20 [Mycolicibacterium vanbaalenii PYR-1]MCV7126129.1 Hsp20/alpha crystallin family protein [Mycolicibacterium vanbaalenii PYR-1]MDW5612253.1 Hsp20/alpha crystallin family protein [Mycolicibacterium sp. D5.8-2]PQP39165.1 Hsp20/alpha crystallin family protein [Mycolicibacterium austroafricanum]QZY44531.1 Hsp20/alpha crystallin family protein [Mycolicibacterium austroafricanum]